jgi:hypothetical protein
MAITKRDALRYLRVHGAAINAVLASLEAPSSFESERKLRDARGQRADEAELDAIRARGTRSSRSRASSTPTLLMTRLRRAIPRFD